MNGNEYTPYGLNSFYFTVDELNAYRGGTKTFLKNFRNFNSKENPENYLVNLKKYLDSIPNNSFVIFGLKGNADTYFNWREQTSYFMNLMEGEHKSNPNAKLPSELKANPYNLTIFNDPNIIYKNLPYLILLKKVNNNFNILSNPKSVRSFEGVVIQNYKLIGDNNVDIKISETGVKYNLLNEKKLSTITTIFDYRYGQCKYLYLRPMNFSKFITIDSLNKQSFVYLSNNKPGAKYNKYSNSPHIKEKSFIEKSEVLLNSKDPQRWEFIPVDKCGLIGDVFIRTHDRPYYYLYSNGDNINVTLTKGSSNQIWNVKQTHISDIMHTYHIISKNTKMYLSYRSNQ